MKKSIVFIILLALVFSLAACSPDQSDSEGDNNTTDQEEPYDQTDDSDDSDSPGIEDDDDSSNGEGGGNEEPEEPLDEQIEDTMMIEGMEEMITLNLYNPGIAPFRTYVPTDFLAENESNDDGDFFWFYANYGSNKNENVYLQVYFLPIDLSEEPSMDDTDTAFSTLLTGMSEIGNDEMMYGWTIREYMSENGPDYAMLGEHNGRYFLMILRYYGEYAEGFIPRANKIIEHFYWTDTQEYLAP